MKKANFNTLQNLPVPEKWIENALAIPKTEEQKAAVVPYWRKPRFIAMAASLVLVSALSLALFLTMGGNTPVAVKTGSKDAATEIIWSTDENGATIATEIVVIPADDDRKDGTEPTETKSGIARFFERLFGTESNPSPTTAPHSGRRGTISPTSKPSATESGKTPPTFKPTPTEDGAPYSTETPTESATAAPTELPWFPDNPTEPCGNDATQPPARPTQPPSYPRTISVRLNKNFSGVTEDSTVYVSVYDSDGNRLGDSDPFSSQHIAQISVGMIYVTVSYTPGDYGILPQDGSYRYEVYNERGKTLATGTARLSV